jgi:hypothetical protein
MMQLITANKKYLIYGAAVVVAYLIYSKMSGKANALTRFYDGTYIGKDGQMYDAKGNQIAGGD